MSTTKLNELKLNKSLKTNITNQELIKLIKESRR